MNSEKKHFFIKLNPPRPSFAQNLTEEEIQVMQEHSDYWRDLQAKGYVIVFGLVFDPLIENKSFWHIIGHILSTFSVQCSVLASYPKPQTRQFPEGSI